MDEFLKMYYGSIGGNSTFLLNLPPDTRGLIHENDAARMKEFGNFIREIFKENLALNAEASADESTDESHSVQNMFDGNKNAYCCQREGTKKCNVKIDLKYEREFDKVIVRYIKFTITNSRWCPEISNMEIYLSK